MQKENTILMVILEVYHITNVEGSGSAVTERHGCRIGAKINKGRHDGLTIRKLISLQKGVR